jgi:hypothetical protein
MWHVWGTREVHIQLCWGDLRERDHLEEPRRRWGDNIKLDHQEAGWGGMDWTDLAEDKNRLRALVHVVMNLLVP